MMRLGGMMAAALGVIVLAGCVTTTTGSMMDSDTVSGWSFVNGGSSPKQYAFAVVSGEDGHPVRSGDSSLRFEVRSGDCGWIGSWNDCSTRRERRELRQADNLNSGERWYHWSIWLPAEYPVIWQSKRTNLGQFHNKGHRHPPFMFRVSGEAEVKDGKYVFAEYYMVMNHLDPAYKTRHIANKLLSLDDMRGRWSDFLAHVKWTSGDEGFFRVYVNGQSEPAYEWFGPTQRRNFSSVFFKFGIYTTDVTAEMPTRIVYYDDVRKGRTCSDVTEYFDCSKLVAAKGDR